MADSSLTDGHPLAPCWFCGQPAGTLCRCGRTYCDHHGVRIGTHCMVCALGYGVYERSTGVLPDRGGHEPVSNIIILSLSLATGDPYIVIPPGLHRESALPMEGVERLLGALVQMLESHDFQVRSRAALVLANTTNSWPTLDPSRLARHDYGTGLIAADQVRRWLLHVLQECRTETTEPTGVAILDQLRTADFRDLYPSIVENLKTLACSNQGTRVSEVFQAIGKFYPTALYTLNERCELLVYEQFTNHRTGAGAIMERMYGPRLRYAPELAKMLKKGVWHSSYARFREWYPDEEEPY